MKRLPTRKEFQELIDKCTWQKTSDGGYNVYGPNGNHIFLPAAGFTTDNYSQYHARYDKGFYWSDDMQENGSNYVLEFSCASKFEYVRVLDYASTNEFSIRLVSDTEGIDLGLSVRWFETNECSELYGPLGRTYSFNDVLKLIKNISAENQTVNITIPKGKIAKQMTDENGDIIIKFVDPEPIRSKSWEEFCKNHPDCEGEYFIDYNGDVSRIDWTTSERGANSRGNLLQTQEDANAILALIQLTRLHDEWVGDWKPKPIWDGHVEIKYEIIIQSNKINVVDFGALQSLLMFPTREMAEEFVNCFRDLIEKAKRYI